MSSGFDLEAAVACAEEICHCGEIGVARDIGVWTSDGQLSRSHAWNMARALLFYTRRELRVCKCGALVSGPLDHPCDKCGSLEGELVLTAWPKLQTELKRCREELADAQ